MFCELHRHMENVDQIKRGEPVRDPDKMNSVKVAADVK